MATYQEWNSALAKYVTCGFPAGSAIYLSVDDDVLEDIGRILDPATRSGATWTDDFVEAVRLACVTTSADVSFGKIGGRSDDGLPDCVAFLGAMVLAAYYMAGEDVEYEIIAENNYFKRLRQILGLPFDDRGRPAGLKPAGTEEILWKKWNRWLVKQGLLPSAELGKGAATRYINYPLSQALLRRGDKERIEALFLGDGKSGKLARIADVSALSVWFRDRVFNSRHLTELSHEKDSRRFGAAIDALLELHASMEWTPGAAGQRSNSRSMMHRRLVAGFYRSENPLTGVIEYLLYVPQPKRAGTGTLEIEKAGRRMPLRSERPGWFMPLWEESLVGGISYTLHGDARSKEVSLPARGFWILVRDADDPASTIFANWHQPEIGETFLIVCRKDYAEQLRRLKDENLLDWSEDPNQLTSLNQNWVEYRECLVLSPDWDGVIAESTDLYEALYPRISASISFTGGLRVPNQRTWVEGFTPQISISAFDDRARVTITNIVSSETQIFDKEVPSKMPITDLPTLLPGDYLIEAFITGKLAARQSLRILSWESLEPADPDIAFKTCIGGRWLCGTVLTRD
jgi:hypothetical protein